MPKRIKKWGNSLAVRIPKREAKQLNLHENTRVEVKKEGSKLLVQPKKDKLKTLLEKVTEQNKHSLNFPNHNPQGKEIW